MHGVTMKFKHTVSSDTFFPKLPVKHALKFGKYIGEQNVYQDVAGLLC